MGFNNQTGPIMVHIYTLIYMNLHVKYGSNPIRTFWVKIQNIKNKIHFFRVMLVPYIKSRGTGGTKMSANADLITMETYVQQGKTNPTSNPRLPNFQDSKSSSQSRHMYYKGNKATRSPKISRQHVQKLTHAIFFIYIGFRFPLSLSTIWGNHLPFSFMLKFPISTIWRNHLPFNLPGALFNISKKNKNKSINVGNRSSIKKNTKKTLNEKELFFYKNMFFIPRIICF